MNRSSPGWSRRYPPLLAGIMALILAAFVLPSSLNLPQTNPTQTLEYAPVPPTDKDAPTQSGNLASLGLGTTSTSSDDALGGTGPGAAPLPQGPGPGAGTTPRTKRCVGNPPRQTEDPLAPPCVAFFQGDNFGSTYRGVTRDEIRVVFYHDGDRNQLTADGTDEFPADKIIDLDAPPKQEDDFAYLRMFRAYGRYFNDRYMTYGRRVHLYVHFSSVATAATATTAATYSPETRRADAAKEYAEVHPFATIPLASTAQADFVNAMTAKGVVIFLGMLSGVSAVGQPAAFFRRDPGLAWSYIPSLEERAKTFAALVCRKIAPYPVSFSGTPSDMGKPRKLAILRRNAPLEAMTPLVEREIKACGAHIWLTRTFTEDGEQQAAAAQNVAALQQAGITTVIVTGAREGAHTRAASAIGFRPEWVAAGDEVIDRPLEGRLQDPEQWQHARVTSLYPRVSSVEDQQCVRAYREADQNEPMFNVKNYGCDFYVVLRQLFTAIQVAGPRLTPQRIDEGFHAIPAVRSTNPTVPTCYYGAGDYTCVKDAVMTWYDPQGHTPGSNQPGCYRVMHGGERYTASTWPEGDIEKERSASDPCNVQGPDVA